MQKLAKFKGDVRRMLRKIVPKPAGEKLNFSKADKILNRVLQRQENQDERQALLSSQDSNYVRSGRSTTTPTHDSQTFASARSYAKIQKSLWSLKDTKKYHNLLSSSSKENQSAKQSPVVVNEHLIWNLGK